MTDSEILKTMARYNQWANRDLFAAVRALPEGEVVKQRRSLFKNILNTLNHLCVPKTLSALIRRGITYLL